MSALIEDEGVDRSAELKTALTAPRSFIVQSERSEDEQKIHSCGCAIDGARYTLERVCAKSEVSC